MGGAPYPALPNILTRPPRPCPPLSNTAQRLPDGWRGRPGAEVERDSDGATAAEVSGEGARLWAAADVAAGRWRMDAAGGAAGFVGSLGACGRR